MSSTSLCRTLGRERVETVSIGGDGWGTGAPRRHLPQLLSLSESRVSLIFYVGLPVGLGEVIFFRHCTAAASASIGEIPLNGISNSHK